MNRSVEDREVRIKISCGDLLRHRDERCDAAAACEGDDIFGIPERLIVKCPEGHRAVEQSPFRYIFKEIVRHEIRAVPPDRDLNERFLPPRLKGCRGDGIRPVQDAFADLQIEIDVLTALEDRDMAVDRLETEGLRGRGGISHLRDDKAHLIRMQKVSEFTDRILRLRYGTRVLIAHAARLRDSGGSADVFQEAVYFHFPAPPIRFLMTEAGVFLFFAASASRIPFAAARPLVTAGPMPFPDMPCAPANSRPLIK